MKTPIKSNFKSIISFSLIKRSVLKFLNSLNRLRDYCTFINVISIIFIFAMSGYFVFMMYEEGIKSLYFFVSFIFTFVMYDYLSNNYKYSDYRVIRLLQKIFIILFKMFLVFLFGFILNYLGLSFIKEIYCDSDSDDESDNYDILGLIKNFIDNFSSFLSTLNLEQLGALVHITSSIFILMCLFSIIVIICSDYLLNKLKLEDKYPKIGKIIRIRKTFQKYYLILNFILIIVTLLAIIFVNLNVLF